MNQDFIPEGGDTGAFANGGFQDFVPTPAPTAETAVVAQKAPQSPSFKELKAKAKELGLKVPVGTSTVKLAEMINQAENPQVDPEVNTTETVTNDLTPVDPSTEA